MATPTLDQTALLRQNAEREHVFWREHYGQFVEQYPDQFVAVRGGEVVAMNSDLQQLVITLRAQEIDPRDVWVRFIAATPRRMLL